MGSKRMRFDGSTKTFYFETYVKQSILSSILAKYRDCDELCYFRYLSYPIIDKKLVKCEKIIGVLQFAKRLSKTTVSRMFVADHVFMDVLQPAVSPTVLCHLKMYPTYSNTPFGFGGRKTTHEVKFMRPYFKALTVYKDCYRPGFLYKGLPGARTICKFKYMLEKN
jgi:hypothetical protein